MSKAILRKEHLILNDVASIILAGGQGTRLYPLTMARCKPAVSFGGRYRLIDVPISNSLNSYITKIFVITQYLSAGLHQHILSTYQSDIMRHVTVELLTPEETPEKKVWFKGTADAVRQNLKHILKTSADFFLILSGDQLYNMNYGDLIEFAKKQDCDLTIAALPVKEQEAQRMGLLKIDHSFFINDFYEKPNTAELLKRFEFNNASNKTSDNHYLGSMGIYVFKRSALISLLQEQGDDFGRDLIPIEVKKGSASAYVFNGYWEDIGTVRSYFEANLALTDKKNCLNIYDDINPIFTYPHQLPSPMISNAVINHSLLSEGTVIDGATIDHSVIGIRSHIKKGTVIKDSILVGNHFFLPPAHQSPPLPKDFSIGEHCRIENTIIDEHCSIGNRVKLINKQGLTHFDSDKLYVRDGIIIVTSGTSLPDGFEF